MTDLVSLLFIAMIPIDFKVTNFSLHLLLYHHSIKCAPLPITIIDAFNVYFYTKATYFNLEYKCLLFVAVNFLGICKLKDCTLYPNPCYCVLLKG